MIIQATLTRERNWVVAGLTAGTLPITPRQFAGLLQPMMSVMLGQLHAPYTDDEVDPDTGEVDFPFDYHMVGFVFIDERNPLGLKRE